MVCFRASETCHGERLIRRNLAAVCVESEHAVCNDTALVEVSEGLVVMIRAKTVSAINVQWLNKRFCSEGTLCTEGRQQ